MRKKSQNCDCGYFVFFFKRHISFGHPEKSHFKSLEDRGRDTDVVLKETQTNQI